MLWGVTTMTFTTIHFEAVEFIGSCGFDCVESGLIAWDEKGPAPPS